MNFVESVREFNAIAGTPEEFNPRKTALYTGLILEEVAELIESYNDTKLQYFSHTLDRFSHEFKRGDYDDSAATIDRVEALDAAVDIAVVALGCGIAVGSDIVAACDEVANSNLSKFPMVNGERVVIKDENGKVKKPPEFWAPSLEQYLKNNTAGEMVFGSMAKELTK